MPGQPLDIEYPTSADTPLQAVDKLSAGMLLIQTDLEGSIVPADIDWSSDLSARGYALTNLGLATLAARDSSTADPGSWFYYAGEHYLATGDGAIQITDNGALNASALGGITGDFGGANPARVEYENGTGEYRFTEDPGVYADLRCDDLILVGSGSGSVRLSCKSDVTTATNFTIATPPASGTAFLTVNSAGDIVQATSVTVAQTCATMTVGTLLTLPSGSVTSLGMTMNGAADFNSICVFDGACDFNSTANFDGAVTMTSTLDVTGELSVTAGITTAGQAVKHGTRWKHLNTITSGSAIAASTTLYVTLPSFESGERIRYIKARIASTAGTDTIDLKLGEYTDGSFGLIAGCEGTITFGSSPSLQTCTLTLPYTFSVDSYGAIQLAIILGASDDCTLYGLSFGYDRITD